MRNTLKENLETLTSLVRFLVVFFFSMDLGEDLGGGKAFYSLPLSPFIYFYFVEVCYFFHFHFLFFFYYYFYLSLFLFVLFLLG